MAKSTSEAPHWRKSTRSGVGGDCVEVVALGDLVGVRDSKDPTGPVLTFPLPAWRAFVAAIRHGEFDQGR
jgi:hypothetical protein